MTKVKISYWLLLRPLLFANLFVLVLAVLGYVFIDPEVMKILLRTGFPLLCVVINATLFFVLASNAPPTFIQVDKPAKTVTYARLLRSQLVVLKYQQVHGEFVVRRNSKAGPVKGWALFQEGRELFFVAFHASGWTEAQLHEVHSQLKPRI